jgi:hypothetical protein
MPSAPRPWRRPPGTTRARSSRGVLCLSGTRCVLGPPSCTASTDSRSRPSGRRRPRSERMSVPRADSPFGHPAVNRLRSGRGGQPDTTAGAGAGIMTRAARKGAVVPPTPATGYSLPARTPILGMSPCGRGPLPYRMRNPAQPAPAPPLRFDGRVSGTLRSL